MVFFPDVTTGRLHSPSPTVFSAPLASKSRNLSNAEYGGTVSQSRLNFCQSRIADWLNLHVSSAAAVISVKAVVFHGLKCTQMLVQRIVQVAYLLALPSFRGRASRMARTWAW